MNLKNTLILGLGLLFYSANLLSQDVNIGYKEIFVSPKGNDKADGSINKPVKTLHKAKSMVEQEMDQLDSLRLHVNIVLLAGIHRLSEPLIHTSDKFGKNSKGVTYTNYEDETPVVSGAKVLENLNWKPYRDGIQKAKIKEKMDFPQLYMNGEKQPMARYPNFDKNIRHFNGYAGNAISPERVITWKNPKGGIIHAMHSAEWGGYQYTIEGKNANGELNLTGGFQNNRQMGMHKEYRMVENIFEELDAPNEWFYDRDNMTLYYYAPQGLDLSKALFEVPQTEVLFEMRGTEKQPVANVGIRGLELCYTQPTFMKTSEPLLRSDWMIHRGGAVLMQGVEDCWVDDCNIHDIGGNAIFVSNYARGVYVTRSHIHNIGASGVCFVGSPDAVRSPSFEYYKFVPYEDQDKERGPKANIYPMNCFAMDNLIHDMGLIEKQGAGIQISMARRIVISKNSIYNLPRSGINISEGTWGGHRIEGNDVFNTVLETGDHGSFNSWGRDRFWLADRGVMDKLVEEHPDYYLQDAIETTLIVGNRWQCFHGWDIDLDDGSSNYIISNNLCLNGGLKLREGFHRIVTNNVIVNNSFHPHVWFKNSEDEFMFNIVTRGYYPIGVNDWGTKIDRNLFPNETSLALAHKEGTDKHSKVGNPLFLNPVKGDYRVADNSPALALGFRNFDMSSFGVQHPPLKAIRQEPVLPTLTLPADSRAEKDTEKLTMSWLGADLKTMTTEGERSATGMAKITGVIINKLDNNSQLKKAGVKANSAIIGIEGVEITNCDDLMKLIPKIGQQTQIKITVFQNQAPEEYTIILNK